MKKKKYLKVMVTTHGGTVFSNQLRLSEAHFISQLAQENKILTVQLIECDEATYNVYFL